MKNLYTTIYLFLFFLIGQNLLAQNIRFSYSVVPLSATTSRVDVFANTTSGTENLTGYTVYFYYDNAETAVSSFDATPTTVALGWTASNQSNINHQAENNAAVSITHTGYFFYQNFDVAFAGDDMTTSPTLLLSINFDHTNGSSTTGGFGWLAETDEVPPLVYVDNLFNSYSVFVTGTQSQSLPIDLSQFTARSVDNRDALLEWETASERNGAYFGIERSVDGRQWQAIEQVAAFGNSLTAQQYQYTDKEIHHQKALQKEVYYRLKLVDLDGSFEYSPVRVVNFEGQAVSLKVFPNPSAEYIQIVTEANEFTVEIYNLNGQKLMSIDNQRDLDISKLPAASYQLVLIDQQGQQSESVRLVVMDR